MGTLLFLSTAAVIVLAGTNLSRYGDILATKGGLGRTWVGLVLTASVTSLPELVTGLSSTVLHAAPDVAVGDIAGSCVFNLLLLTLVDLLRPRSAPTPELRSGHAITLTAGMAGLGIVAMALVLSPRMPRVGWVGVPTLALVPLYFAALRMAFDRRPTREPAPPGGASVQTRKAAALYGMNAVVVVAAAGFLPRLAVDFAERTGLGQSFVGSALVGATTSLPEVAVTIAAVRMGAADLAVGNLLGSNLFDLLILAIDDVAYTPGPILERVGSSHLIPVMTALLMSSVLGVAWYRRAWPRAPGRVPTGSLTLAVLYVAQLVVLYLSTRR